MAGLLSTQELSETASGKENIELRIEIKDIEPDNALKAEAEKAVPGFTLGPAVEINLYKDVYVGSELNGSEKVSETGIPVKFTIEIPENLRKSEKGYSREFGLVRDHAFSEGNHSTGRIARDVNEEDWTVSFENDKYSVFWLWLQRYTAAAGSRQGKPEYGSEQIIKQTPACKGRGFVCFGRIFQRLMNRPSFSLVFDTKTSKARTSILSTYSR